MDYEQAMASAEALDGMRKSIKKGGVAEERLDILEAAFRPIIDRQVEIQKKKERKVETDYLDFNPSKEVSRAVHALLNGPAYYLTACDELRRRENETQDYLHLLELVDEPDEILTQRAKEIGENQRDRRVAKNFIELMKPLSEFTSRNQKLLGELKKIHGEILKKEQNMKLRVYTPKEKTSMAEAFQKANEGRGLNDE